MLDLRGKRRAMGLFSFCFLLTEKEVTKVVSHWLFYVSKSVVAVVFMRAVRYCVLGVHLLADRLPEYVLFRQGRLDEQV